MQNQYEIKSFRTLNVLIGIFENKKVIFKVGVSSTVLANIYGISIFKNSLGIQRSKCKKVKLKKRPCIYYLQTR